MALSYYLKRLWALYPIQGDLRTLKLPLFVSRIDAKS